MLLIFGKTGQISRSLAQATNDQFGNGYFGQVQFVDRSKVDLNRPGNIRQAILERKPQVVINAAGYTAVDQAETESDEAMRVNAESPGFMADACEELGIPFIHYSTDYVYKGDGVKAWLETDTVAPISAYGRSKAAGDLEVAKRCSRHIILRTAWVYSVEGKNFVRTMLRLGAEKDTLRVVGDQVGSPTSAAEIARSTYAIVPQILNPSFKDWGVYHLVASGHISWHGFAKAIFEEAASLGFPLKVRDVQAILSSEYPTPAKRPLNSRLDTSKLERVFRIKMKEWRPALVECLKTIRSKEL
jgi:dTDP-4-dehydrorhamnose reductase